MNEMLRKNCEATHNFGFAEFRCGEDFAHDGKHKATTWTEGHADTVDYEWDDGGHTWIDGYADQDKLCACGNTEFARDCKECRNHFPHQHDQECGPLNKDGSFTDRFIEKLIDRGRVSDFGWSEAVGLIPELSAEIMRLRKRDKARTGQIDIALCSQNVELRNLIRQALACNDGVKNSPTVVADMIEILEPAIASDRGSEA